MKKPPRHLKEKTALPFSSAQMTLTGATLLASGLVVSGASALSQSAIDAANLPQASPQTMATWVEDLPGAGGSSTHQNSEFPDPNRSVSTSPSTAVTPLQGQVFSTYLDSNAILTLPSPLNSTTLGNFSATARPSSSPSKQTPSPYNEGNSTAVPSSPSVSTPTFAPSASISPSGGVITATPSAPSSELPTQNPSPSASPALSPSADPSNSVAPSGSPAAPSASPSADTSIQPSEPSETPSASESPQPVDQPSVAPQPSSEPQPSVAPQPITVPSQSPSPEVTSQPAPVNTGSSDAGGSENLPLAPEKPGAQITPSPVASEQAGTFTNLPLAQPTANSEVGSNQNLPQPTSLPSPENSNDFLLNANVNPNNPSDQLMPSPTNMTRLATASPASSVDPGNYLSLGVTSESLPESIPGTAEWVSAFLNNGSPVSEGKSNTSTKNGITNADPSSNVTAQNNAVTTSNIIGNNIISGNTPLIFFTILSSGLVLVVILVYRRTNKSN